MRSGDYSASNPRPRRRDDRVSAPLARLVNKNPASPAAGSEWRVLRSPDRGSQVRRRLAAGGKRIRTPGPGHVLGASGSLRRISLDLGLCVLFLLGLIFERAGGR